MQLDLKHRGYAYLMVLIGLIIMLLLGTVYSWGVFTFEVESIFDVGSTLGGLPYMVSLVFYALFMFLSGKYIDHFHPRKILMVGSLLLSIGWILSSFVTELWMLVITYGVIAGSGVGIAYGVPLKVVNLWFTKHRGLASGLVLVGFGLSPVVTAPIAKTFVIHYGLFSTYLILGISFGLLLLMLSLLIKSPEEDHESNSLIFQQTVLKREEMVKTTLFKGLYINLLIGTTIGLMMIGISSIIGVEYMEMKFSTVTLLLSLFAISNGIGRPIFGMITDKYSAKIALYISYFLLIIGSMMMLLADKDHNYLYIISFLIFWFNLGGILAIVSTTTVKRFGSKYFSQNYGLIFTAYGLGAIFGVLSSGFFLDVLHDINYIFIMVIILSFVGMLTAKIYVHKGKQ